ncbi:MAG: cadherin repeat domain-containing protein [Planctomycetota bacterium]
MRARDGGREPRSRSASVEIRVVDVNDNEPRVVSPRESDVVYVVTSLAAPGSDEPLEGETVREFARVTADFEGGADGTGRMPIALARVLTKDADRSARHRFGVTGGDQHAAFDIDETSGVLRLTARSQKDLAALEPGCHVIVVTVTDKGPHQVFFAQTTVSRRFFALLRRS